MNPYSDVVFNDYRIRSFDHEADENDYVWHRDYCDRYITALEGEGWQIQFDNELPTNINIGKKIFIPSMVYHRLIPNKNTKLRIRIDEKL